ncbi:MAG: protein kinase [Verrucomicrobia subdivision 3 bacterium]|nr:protein kinase [Limisphaerales bacterium]
MGDEETIRLASAAVTQGERIDIPAHHLLRPIGKGGYGTIWLAVNAMGTYRAVKVVYRSNFREDRPYEREYAGIKHFEPLSRAHEGFADILQVERNDRAGYFYYVMELADDSVNGQQIIPENYSGLTLGGLLQQRGRLPLEECLLLGTSLSAALDYLHKNKLVHRDIKASNIILVNGTPKLVDIGLVTEISEDSTFIGTPGFIPPEGPGTPAADIYSLGKVLYEASTGLDRYQFPAFPEDSLQTDQSRAQSEWKAILLKACEDNVKLRYQSATELQAHLALLRAGKSVTRLLQFEHLIAMGRRFGPIAAALVLLIPLLLFQIVREKRRAAEDRQRQAGSYVGLGSRALADGEYLSALPWFVRALELDEDESGKALTHRVRIASALQHSPKLIQMRFHKHEWGYGEFGETDDQILSPFAERRSAVWDVRSGVQLSPQFGSGKHGQEKSSFSRDRRKIVTCNADRVARVWDVGTGKLIGSYEHVGWVLNARLSPDGNRIVTTENGVWEARVWNVSSGEQELLLRGHSETVWFANFSPDGRRIVTTTQGGQAKVWDASTGALLASLTGHTYWVRYAAFSPDSRWVATASGDHSARIWEAETGREVVPPLRHPDHVGSAEFSPDGKWLVTACLDGSAHIWDTKTGMRALPTLHHSARIEHAAFSPSGARVLTVFIDGTVCVWELRSPQPTPLTVPVAFSGDGFRCALITNEMVAICETLDSAPSQTIRVPNRPVTGLTLDSEGTTLLTTVTSSSQSGAADQVAQLWDVASGEPRGQPIPCDRSLSQWLLSSAANRIAAWGGANLIIWNAETGQRQLTVSRPSGARSATRLAFDGRGNRVAIGHDRRVELWTLRGAEFHLLCSLSNKLEVSHIAYSPDDTQVLTSWSDTKLNPGSAQLWKAETGQPLGPPLAHRDGVLYAAFSPQGDRIITCSEDFTAVLWDAKNGRRVPVPPLKHDDQVQYAAFSQNDRWVLTVEKGGAVRIWDAFSGELVAPPIRHSDPLKSARFITGDRRILAQSIDGPALVWELPRDDRPIPDLSLVAQLLSGQRSGQFTTDELQKTWQFLQSRYPKDFLPER